MVGGFVKPSEKDVCPAVHGVPLHVEQQRNGFWCHVHVSLPLWMRPCHPYNRAAPNHRDMFISDGETTHLGYTIYGAVQLKCKTYHAVICSRVIEQPMKTHRECLLEGECHNRMESACD